MTLSKILSCLIFLSVSFLQADQRSQPQTPHESSEERPMCTILTQGQTTRYERCLNGEVMTGIRSLDPLMVYCTRLLANCRSTRPLSTE